MASTVSSAPDVRAADVTPGRADAPTLQRPLATGMLNALGVVNGMLPGGIYSVLCDGVPLRCQRAASCLLRPEIGDTVLVSGPDLRRLYLTAVAEQAAPDMARIDVTGDLTLASSRGSVTLEGATHVSLCGGESLAMESPALRIQAESANMRIGQTEFQGEQVRATVLDVRLIGRLYEAVVDRLVHLSRSAFRMTEELDQVRAGQIDYQAERMVRVHGKNTFVTASELAKVDGKQIHMG